MNLANLISADPVPANETLTDWYLFGTVAPGRTLTRFPIASETFVIGRRPGLDLTLSSHLVSGRHAEILVVGEGLFIRDLGSRNGTFVNRVRVTQATPIGRGDHIELADMEFRIEYRPSLSGLSATGGSYQETASEMMAFEADWMLTQLDELIAKRAITPHYQPILKVSQGAAYGYEALARSRVAGLENPRSMFEKAALIQREVELSLLCRARAVSRGRQLPHGSRIFLNTHPAESLQVDVLPSLRTLLTLAPNHHLVVEIHEAAIDDPKSVRRFIAELRDAGIGIAYDDFGAGRSRLVELIQAPPDFLKFDISLIRKIHDAPYQQQQVLQTLVDMVHDMGTAAIAEGIEQREEADCCIELGFDYLQGYLIGRPQPVETYSPEKSKSNPVASAANAVTSVMRLDDP